MSFLIYTLATSGILFTLLGVFIFIKLLILPKKPPADTSNRINHIRLVWFAINSPEMFIELFPWLMKDELDNLNDSIT